MALFTRAGRRLVLTDAGRTLRPHAEATLREAEEAADSVKQVRSLAGGTVSFGTFGSAHHSLLGGLVEDFRRAHPDVRVRVVGQNSVEVADAVREGRLEAGLIALPVDDTALEVRPAVQERNHYVSADPRRVRKPKTIEELAAAPLILYDARWGPVDPLRRLLAERAQRAGVRLEPDIEVEYLTAALDLAARGLGDRYCVPSVLESRGYTGRLHSVSLDPPLFDNFAFVTRRSARLSSASRAFLELAERRVAAMGTGA